MAIDVLRNTEVNAVSGVPAQKKAPDGKTAPAVFPTGGDLQTGNPTYSGAPQQGQGTPAPGKGAAPPPPPTFRTLAMQGQARPAPPDQQAMMPQAPAPMAPVSSRDANGNPIPGPGPGYPQPVQAPQQAPPQQAMTPQGGGSPGQFAFGGSSIGGSLQQLLQEMFANPTAYNDDVIQAQRQAGMGRLDQEGAMAKSRLDEEMAGRGLFSSTVAQGRLGDIDINRQNAMADMESRFLSDRARATDEGRRATAGLGMDYDRLAFDKSHAGAQLGLAREGLEFDRENATANRAQRGSEFDRSYGLDRDRFGEDGRRFDATESRLGSQFDKTYGLDREDLGLRRDMFGDSVRRDDRNFDAGRDDEKWGRDLDYYDRYSTSDLVDGTGYNNPQATPPRPPNAPIWDQAGRQAIRDWEARYGSGR